MGEKMTDMDKFEKELEYHKKTIKQLLEEKKYETINICKKEFFHNWFITAIGDGENGDYDLFEKCVKELGISWKVIRNIPSEQFEQFATYLWEKKTEIMDGKYHYWESDLDEIVEPPKNFFLARERPYSYESKVCFAINPQGYYLIYDSYNREALVKLHGKKWDDVLLKNFHKTAKEYIESKKLSTDENEYFKADFELWASGKELSRKKK